MIKKGDSTRNWLINLRGKKIDVIDIVPFAMLGFVAVKNCARLQMASEKVSDLSIKVSLQIIALEELAKPLMIYELVPAYGEVFNIKNETIKSFIKAFFFHSTKQGGIASYGENFGRLGYKNRFTEEELSRLESIKQRGFYTEIQSIHGRVAIPFDSSAVDKAISDKVSLILSEKRMSLEDIYGQPFKTLQFYVYHSVLQMSSVKAEAVAFLKYADFSGIDTFDKLIDLVKSFEQEPVDGKLLVDEYHPDASAKTMSLLFKLATKRMKEKIYVSEASLYKDLDSSVFSEKRALIKKAIYKRLGNDDIVTKVKECIEIEGVTFKKESLFSSLQKSFFRLFK